MNETLLLQKEVDKSVLYPQQGIPVPKMFHNLFYERTGIRLHHGERCNIKIMLDGILYNAELINQKFSREKYPTHADILQIRYKDNNLVMALRKKFVKTFNAVEEFRSKPENKGKQLKLQKEQKE